MGLRTASGTDTWFATPPPAHRLPPPPPAPRPPLQTVIAKETARQLGLGTNITTARGLPTLDASGHVPDDLGTKYGPMILAADGFAEVSGRPWLLLVPGLGVVVFWCLEAAALGAGCSRTCFLVCTRLAPWVAAVGWWRPLA